MAKIKKTYEVYTFDELDKEKKDTILNFNFNNLFKQFNVQNRLKIVKNPEKLIEKCLKEAKQLSYFKNGEIANIKS